MDTIRPQKVVVRRYLVVDESVLRENVLEYLTEGIGQHLAVLCLFVAHYLSIFFQYTFPTLSRTIDNKS